MDNHKVIQLDDMRIIALFAASFVLGAITILVISCVFEPAGWLLNSSPDDLDNLNQAERALLTQLITKGSVFSASNLLSNFTSYYHALVSTLIALFIFVGGFVLLNFYKSKEEHDGLLENRLNKFFTAFERNLSSQNAEEHLHKYEELHSYLDRRITDLIQQSPDLQDYKNVVKGCPSSNDLRHIGQI